MIRLVLIKEPAPSPLLHAITLVAVTQGEVGLTGQLIAKPACKQLLKICHPHLLTHWVHHQGAGGVDTQEGSVHPEVVNLQQQGGLPSQRKLYKARKQKMETEERPSFLKTSN